MRFISNAHEGWGAHGKAAALRDAFHFRVNFEDGATRSVGSSTVGTRERGDSLDLATLLKARQVLSGEIVLDSLLAKLLEIPAPGPDRTGFGG